MKGSIVKYFSRRGFGFITPEGTSDEIFFHVSNFPAEVEPQIGNDVEFEMIETPKGKEAKDVQLLGGASEDEAAEAEEPEEEAPEAEALGVGEITGVGKATAEKLIGAGFETVASVAAVDADTVSEKAGISAKVAAKIVASAKALLE